MNWPNYLSAAGATIEFIGFLILATELIQTNKGSVREAKELAAVKDDPLGTMIWGQDDKTGEGRSEVRGGI